MKIPRTVLFGGLPPTQLELYHSRIESLARIGDGY